MIRRRGYIRSPMAIRSPTETTSARIDHGSGPSLDDATQFTFVCWINWQSITTTNRVLASKHDGGTNGWTCRVTNAGNPVCFWNTSGTATSFSASDTPFATLNRWVRFAVVFDRMVGAAMFTGTEHMSFRANAGTSVAGTGTPSSDAANTLQIFNRGTDTASPFADMAAYAYFRRLLSVGELDLWSETCFDDAGPAVTRDMVLCAYPGEFGGLIQALDYSGYNNHGTGQGMSLIRGPARPSQPTWLKHRGIYRAADPAAVGTTSPYYASYYYPRIVAA